MKDVIVVGGTGYLGRPLIEKLNVEGFRVAAVARPQSADKIPHGCTPISGDALNSRTYRDRKLSVGENEIQTLLPDGVPEHFQRPSFKRMMAARDDYTLRVVPEVGSLRWFLSIICHTNGS